MVMNTLSRDTGGEALKAAVEADNVAAVRAHPEIAPVLSQVGEVRRQMAGSPAPLRDAEAARVIARLRGD